MKPYQDPEVLTELYYDQHLSTYELADRFDVSQSTICRWMDKHDLDRRDGLEARPPNFGISTKGYERWHGFCLGNQYWLSHHRLLAVAEFGFDAVCGMDVHHKNEIRWDNRPDNLELMTRSDHTKHHNAPESAD